MANTTVFFDLDGVLADFDAGALALGVDTEHLNKSRRDLTPDQQIIKQKLYDKIAHSNFFADLPFVSGAEALWKSAESFNRMILTAAPSFRHRADAEAVHNDAGNKKYMWCQKMLGLRSRDQFICTLSHEKKQYVSFGGSQKTVLIDDRPKNIADWTTAGGIGILHKTADESIHTLQKIVASLG